MRQPWALLRIPMGSYGSTDLWQVFSIFSGSATATRRSLLLLSLSSLFFFLHFLNSLPGYILCTSFARLSHFLWMVLICFDVFLHVFEKLIQKCLRKIRFPPRISPPLCRALSIMLCAFGPCPCLVSDRFGQVHRFVSDLWFVEQERDESGTNRGQMQCKATCQLPSTQKQNRLQYTVITLMQSKCAEAATPKRWAQTFWPFQPCGLCNLSLHLLYPCFCSSMFIRWICSKMSSKMSLTCFHPMKQAESLLRKTDDVGHWIRARWENENQWCCVDLGAASRIAQDAHGGTGCPTSSPYNLYNLYILIQLHHDFIMMFRHMSYYFVAFVASAHASFDSTLSAGEGPNQHRTLQCQRSEGRQISLRFPRWTNTSAIWHIASPPVTS